LSEGGGTSSFISTSAPSLGGYYSVFGASYFGGGALKSEFIVYLAVSNLILTSSMLYPESTYVGFELIACNIV